MDNNFLSRDELSDLIQYDNEYVSGNFEKWINATMDYYNGIPSMSDDEFDNLTEEIIVEYLDDFSVQGKLILKVLNKGIATYDNTFKINHDESINKLETQQLSLFKIKFDTFNRSKSEIQKFLKLPSPIGNVYYSPKLDGISIKLILNADYTIQRIQTRGGQDYTSLLSNNPTIVELVEKIKSHKYRYLTIHGELVINKKLFNEKYSEQYKNPRNGINGIVKECPEDLTFIPCTNGINIFNLNGESIWKSYDTNLHLENLYFSEYKNEEYPYQTDGIVISKYIRDEDFQVKDNYPTNFVAVKFKSISSQPTKVIDIEWTMKKSGKLTPVLSIEPVDLDGITINNASCYSFNTLKTLHCGIGSVITITKSGDIIPTVDKVLFRSDDFKLPDNAVLNGKHLFMVDKSTNEDIKKQKFILGLKLLNIEGIGPVISEEIGTIVDYDIIELFNQTHKVDISIKLGTGANLERFKKFYDIKTIPLDLLIEILQFDGVGKSLSKKFADIMLGKTIDTKGINHQILRDTCSNGGKNRIIIQESMNRLKQYGIKVIKPIEISEDNFTFEMTGNPPGMTKQEFVKRLQIKNPNAVHTTLTKNTKYLFTDDISGSSSKANKARKYNVKMLTYQQALEYDFTKDMQIKSES